VPPLRTGQPDGDDHLPGVWRESDRSDTPYRKRSAANDHGRAAAETRVHAVSACSITSRRASGYGSCRSLQSARQPKRLGEFGPRTVRMALARRTRNPG
jgi:hypothetical protein